MTETVVASANILSSLGSCEAGTALDGVLDLAPDLVGLQEWSIFRFQILGGAAASEACLRSAYGCLR